MLTQKNNSVFHEYYTYRISKLPVPVDAESLCQGICDDAAKAITYVSIGSCPYHPEALATATVTFRGEQTTQDLMKNGFEDVEIDNTFYGFTPLNTVDAPAKAIIVAITGLAGRAFESWQNDKGQMWLRDYLAPKFAECRIFTYGYPSRARRSQQQATVADFAETFVSELKAMVSKREESALPLILVGHSLGCIIIKDAIVQSISLSTSPPRLYQSVYGLVLFGAPHRGLNNPELASVVEGTPPESLVRDLLPNSSLLSSLNKAFPIACKDIKIISCFEKEHTRTYQPENLSDPQSNWVKTGPLRFMVPETSACLYWEGESRIPIHKDHSGIAKLDNLTGSPYFEIERQIEETMKEIPIVMRKRRMLRSGPSSVLSLFFMLQYEYYWFRAWWGYTSRNLMLHEHAAATFSSADEFIRHLRLPFGHPARSIVEGISLITNLLSSLVDRYQVSYKQEMQQTKSTIVASGEGASDGQINLRSASIQFSLNLEDERDHRGSEGTNGEDVYQLENWSELDLEQFASLLSQFHHENERLSRLSHHAASIDLLASSKIINKPKRTPEDLNNIADVSQIESFYKPLIERAITKKQRLDLDTQSEIRVAEYPMNRLQSKEGFGSSKYRILLPSHDTPAAETRSQQLVMIEWMRYPHNAGFNLKRRLEKQNRRLAYGLMFPNKPPLLKMLPCTGIVEDLDQNRFGLLLVLPSWIDVAHKPETLYHQIADRDANRKTESLPTLNERFQLARCLAYSIAELHSAGIIHKNLHSENLQFFYRRFSQKVSIADAFICGLEFSRPTGEAMVSVEVDPRILELYRHPELLDSSNEIQGRPASHPKHDIYSLGLILLQIGIWELLEPYFEPKKTPAENVTKFIKLASKNLPFFMGTDYCEAVLECLDQERQNQALKAIAQSNTEDTDEEGLYLEFLIEKVIHRLEM